MVRLGLALKCREEPYHWCLIVSDAKTDDDYVVLVRITSDDGTWPDRACLLGPADWGELDGPSTVAYSTANVARDHPDWAGLSGPVADCETAHGNILAD